MENLDSIVGWLGLGTIWGVGNPPPPGGNDLLLNINALESLTYVGAGMNIGYNNSLSSCDVQSVCDYLNSPNGTIIIEYNAPGCNNPVEVEVHCLTQVEEIKTGNGITIIPNPSNDKITISSPAITGTTQLSIFNVNGEKVMERKLAETETQIDISALPRGVYFLRVQDEELIQVMKLMKK